MSSRREVSPKGLREMLMSEDPTAIPDPLALDAILAKHATALTDEELLVLVQQYRKERERASSRLVKKSEMTKAAERADAFGVSLESLGLL